MTAAKARSESPGKRYRDARKVGSTAGLSFVENRLPLSPKRAHWESRAARVDTTRNRRVTCGHEQGSILMALRGTLRQVLSEASRHLSGDLKALDGPESRGDRRAWFSPDQAPIPRRAGERGWVMRVDGVLNVSAVATRGARMMPKRSKMSKIAGCVRVPSSGAICHLRTRRAIFGRGPTLSSAACHLVWVGSSWPSRARIHSGPARRRREPPSDRDDRARPSGLRNCGD